MALNGAAAASRGLFAVSLLSPLADSLLFARAQNTTCQQCLAQVPLQQLAERNHPCFLATFCWPAGSDGKALMVTHRYGILSVEHSSTLSSFVLIQVHGNPLSGTISAALLASETKYLDFGATKISGVMVPLRGSPHLFGMYVLALRTSTTLRAC